MNRNDYILFSESNSRFLVEVAPECKSEFETNMKGTNCDIVGSFTTLKVLKIFGLNGKKVVDIAIDELKEAWQKPIRW
jgi:phosphoribosylformylglycinamidine synthase subunit PurSL